MMLYSNINHNALYKLSLVYVEMDKATMGTFWNGYYYLFYLLTQEYSIIDYS